MLEGNFEGNPKSRTDAKISALNDFDILQLDVSVMTFLTTIDVNWFGLPEKLRKARDLHLKVLRFNRKNDAAQNRCDNEVSSKIPHPNVEPGPVDHPQAQAESSDFTKKSRKAPFTIIPDVKFHNDAKAHQEEMMEENPDSAMPWHTQSAPI